MKKKHPYDNSLGEKMEQLPVPDVQHNWQEMRRLLDEEMPRGGGYSKRRGGWWLFGTLLIFIITGSWMLTTMNFSRQNADPPLTKKVNISPPPVDGLAGNVLNCSEKPKAEDDQILHRKENEIVNPDPTVHSKARTGIIVPSTENNAGIVRTEKYAKARVGTVGINLPGVSTGKAAGNDPGNTAKHGSRGGQRTGLKQSDVENSASISRDNSTPDAAALSSAAGQQAAAGTSGVVSEAAGPKAARVVNLVHAYVSVADHLDSANINNLLVLDYTPVSRKYYRENKKYGKPVNIRQPYSTTGRTFALGLSLPLGFPLGDQKMLGYNSNAGANTVTDYLPAPHIQYHFSGKSYIQTELQFMSPQFIKPVLLYQDHYSTSSYTTTNSISARKLYYFNIPVSVHYSPFRHFYMGTGLQFSSLISGIAMREQHKSGMVPGGDFYKVSYSKFGNDSLSDRMNGNEMRLMLDANYYWNKFTVGLRYNQALSNYVSMRVAPAVPYSLDKNKALQFYMRYNLWEDRKRQNLSRRTMVKK